MAHSSKNKNRTKARKDAQKKKRMGEQAKASTTLRPSFSPITAAELAMLAGTVAFAERVRK